MNLFRPTIKSAIMILAIGLLHNSCMTDDLNLSNGINTEVTLGGDSLSLPIGSIEPVTLGSILDSAGLDILQKDNANAYTIALVDSTQAAFSAIDPITVNLAPISVPEISTSVSEINIPAFNFDQISLNSNINVPVVSTSSLSIPAVNSKYTPDSVVLSLPSGMRGLNQAPAVTTTTFGPYAFSGNNSINQAINFTFDSNLKKINKIYLKNSVMSITFDKTSINKLAFESQDAKITTFRIDFPAEYHLSSASTGASISSDGRSFIISNADISASNKNTFTYSFVIDYIDLSSVTQVGWLNFSRDITYNMSASFTGTVSSANTAGFVGKKISMGVNIASSPALDDLDMETNAIAISVPGGNSTINQTVNNLPAEVSEISNITFVDGAKLDISITDPGLSPFSFSSGNCVIILPQIFVFKAASGFNTSTNTLTIPYNQLFQTKTLEITGINLNKTVDSNHSITINDALSYTISNLNIGGLSSKLSTMQSIGGNKTLSVKANITGLTVKNAAIKTKQINMNVPGSTATIAIHQQVSDFVKKLYTINMKNPVAITMNIAVEGLPSSIDSLFFDNFKLQFPTTMKFSNPEIVNGLLTLNDGFKVSKGFTKTLTLNSFDFGSSGLVLTNGYFDLNQTISLNADGTGGVYIKSNTLNSSDFSGLNIKVKPSVTIGSMALSMIEGVIDPDFDAFNEDINLNLPSALTDPSNNLDIQNPVVKLDIGNTLGIPFDLDLNIVPKRNGAPITSSIVQTTIAVKRATTIGQFTTTKLYLAKDTSAVSVGYKGVSVPNLPNLLSKIPDEIIIEATPRVTGDRHVVDLNSTNNQIKLKYDVRVPLTFGKNFNIVYQDTITKLKESLSQFSKIAKQIDIIAVITNGIPLNMGLEMKPVDINGNLITDVAINISDSIHSCRPLDGSTTIGVPVETKISLGIKDNSTNGDGFSKIDGFILKIFARKNATIAGIPLKSDQSVGLDLRVRIPKGVTIDLGSNK